MTQANSMYHWNGNQMCALTLRATGKDPFFHEMVSFALLPLDSNCVMRRDVGPINLQLQPDYPAQVDVRHRKYLKIRGAVDRLYAQDIFHSWLDTLGLNANRSQFSRCKIIIVGHNLAETLPFFIKWLGGDEFYDHFDGRYRDTMSIASYLNDRMAMRVENVPFNKVNLSWLAKYYAVPNDKSHDLLRDCLTISEVYQQLMRHVVYSQ